LTDLSFVLPSVSVSLARLAAYNRVCGYRLSDELPPTYPHVLAFPVAMALMTRPDFPLPLVGIVHVANAITVHRPVLASEVLSFTVFAADLRPHQRGQQVDLVAEARVGDEVVWTGRSTYLHRSSRPAGSAPTSAPPAPVPAPVPAPSAVWRVDRRVGPDYADVSGDHNPIHISRVAARLFGFPGQIAHGMWSKARCLAALEGRLPSAYTVEVAFKLPVVLPATVAFSAEPVDGGYRLGLHGARSGKPHLVGQVVSPRTGSPGP
jgi:acyl dehydratase